MADLTTRLDEVEALITDNYNGLGFRLETIHDTIKGIYRGVSNPDDIAYLVSILDALATALEVSSQFRDSFNDIKESLRLAADSTASTSFPPVDNGYSTIQQASIATAGVVEGMGYDSTFVRALLGENVAGDATGTLMSILRAIAYGIVNLQELTTRAQGPQPPTIVDVPVLVGSTGMVFVPAGIVSGLGSATSASWDTAPTGTSIVPSTSGLILLPEAGWAGWLFYVDSDRPTCYIGASLTRYFTNRWVNMPDDLVDPTRQFGVLNDGRIVVYLVPPGTTGGGGGGTGVPTTETFSLTYSGSGSYASEALSNGIIAPLLTTGSTTVTIVAAYTNTPARRVFVSPVALDDTHTVLWHYQHGGLGVQIIGPEVGASVTMDAPVWVYPYASYFDISVNGIFGEGT